MPNINRVTIAGHLGKDPEVKYTQSGTAVASLSVATTERWKDRSSGDNQERTEWHKVTAWAQKAEYVGKYAKKGHAVLVEGKIQTRKWQDRDGNDRYTTEIVASEIHILTPKGGGGSANAQSSQPEAEDFGDDVPF